MTSSQGFRAPFRPLLSYGQHDGRLTLSGKEITLGRSRRRVCESLCGPSVECITTLSDDLHVFLCDRLGAWKGRYEGGGKERVDTRLDGEEGRVDELGETGEAYAQVVWRDWRRGLFGSRR